MTRHFVRFATYTTRAGRMTTRPSWVICYWGVSKADCQRWINETVRRGVDPTALRLGSMRVADKGVAA